MKRTRRDSRVKLPDDFLGTVTALLHTPSPSKGKKRAKKRPAKGKKGRP